MVTLPRTITTVEETEPQSWYEWVTMDKTWFYAVLAVVLGLLLILIILMTVLLLRQPTRIVIEQPYTVSVGGIPNK
jgi:uncharacterized membrane protein YdfJ with MMPL/SSD domain